MRYRGVNSGIFYLEGIWNEKVHFFYLYAKGRNMSESVLNALINLFALASSMNLNPQFSGRLLVKNFLKKYLPEDKTEEYIKLFEDYYLFYCTEVNPDDPIVQTEHSIAERIGKQLIRELPQEERILVFLRLLEFILEDMSISPQERKFIDSIAETFNIPENERNHIMFLAQEGRFNEAENPQCLILEDSEDDRSDELEGAWIERNRPNYANLSCKKTHPGLHGELIFLYLPSSGAVLFKYHGRNSLYLDGRIISGTVPLLFEVGSIIRGKDTEPIYYSSVLGHFLHSNKNPRIILEGRGIEFYFKGSNNGIQNFSFTAESGKMIGVIGGSGVGKSTLLQIISGQLKLHTGEILINGYDLEKDRFKLQGVIGYVPQDDLLFEELTVFQNLYFNARLCFASKTDYEKKRLIHQILTDLDLWEIKDLKVGSPLNKYISGGQRKRLNIALELMREPSILLVDEPTSGLSSMDAEKVVGLLKELSIKGKLVIANIHQPSSDIFKMFDCVWVLDRGGYPVYTGNPIDSIVYFKTQVFHANASESECPVCGTVNTDEVLKIIEARKISPEGKITRERKKEPSEWYQLYKNQIEAKLESPDTRKTLPRHSYEIPGENEQFAVFFLRNLYSKISDVQYVMIALLEAPILALILGWITKYTTEQGYSFSENKNLPQYLFMSVVVSLFVGLTISAEEIFRDRKIILRESFLNLSRFSYINAKVVYLFILSALQTLLFVWIGNSILEIHSMTFSYWLILFSTACFANMLGLNLSSGLQSIIAIYITIPLMLVPQLLLSGAVIHFDDLHRSLTNRVNVPLIGDLMASRWAYEALAVEQFVHNPFEEKFFKTNQAISDYSFKSGFLLPRLQSKLEEARNQLEKGQKEGKLEQSLSTLQNEFSALGKYNEIFPFEYIDQLNVQSFTEDLAEETAGYITYLKMRFFQLTELENQKKDSVYKVLQSELGDSGIHLLRSKYYNDRLAEVVLNRNSIQKIYEFNSRIFPKKDPVYVYPESNFGRAHFYAAYKKLNGQHVPTLWFNVSILWVMIFILYLMLLTDIIRILSNYLMNLRIYRAGKS